MLIFLNKLLCEVKVNKGAVTYYLLGDGEMELDKRERSLVKATDAPV